MICASLTEKTADGMVKVGNETKADLVEVRLDFLEKTGDIEKLSKIRKPLIATCMPCWEGGRFKGSEKERVELLERTLGFASHVTIELRTPSRLRNRLIRQARLKKVKTIIAFHDFKKTPSKESIKRIIEQESRIGDIAKVAFMPKSQQDVLNLINILMEKKPKARVIALSMGSLGAITRIIGPFLGSYLTYGSPVEGKEAGPGQLTVDQLQRMTSAFK